MFTLILHGFHKILNSLQIDLEIMICMLSLYFQNLMIQDFQSIIAPIGRKDTSIIERGVRQDGQYAHTDMTVLKRFVYENEQMSHVHLKLYTGRTHQIRVHAASIGHRLVGDELYGGNRTHIAHQALQCVSLTFEHPITKEPLHFTTELLAQFSSICSN